jgi:RNA polymerase-binding transcription factor DksA
MDEIDRAAERMENFTAEALASVLGKLSARPSNGICRSCFEPIEPRRLQANPRASHCRDCADEEEALARRTSLCGPRF